MFTLVLAMADEYLVRVELDNNRLEPLIQHGLKVIGELEHNAIVIMDESDLGNTKSLNYEILDVEPCEGDYYLVLPMDGELDLTAYGIVLMQDSGDHLIKLRPSMLELLTNEKVMIKRLSFTPMIVGGAARFPDVFYNTTVQEIVDLVNGDSILTYVQRMQDFITRYSTHDSCFAAANWVAEKYSAYGCDSVYLQDYMTGNAPNVIGIKNGVLYPDSIYTVICGHLDATSYLQPNIAPGADDNASGVAATIEAIRVMQGYQFDHSIRFIAFTGEEQGMNGSEYYAQLAHNQGDSILGVLNADMIAYTDVQPESLDVFAKYSNPPCEPFADFFIATADTYTTLLTKKRMTNSMVYSDHGSFWQQGYLALCSIEDFPVTNPYYHSPEDTIGAGYNNNAFCTEATKAQIAALSLLAIPHETGIDDLVQDKPAASVLTVYPRISDSRFMISLHINDPSDMTTVKIYNAAGVLVRNLNANDEIVWNSTDNTGQKVPAGIYFVTVKNHRIEGTEKIIVVR